MYYNSIGISFGFLYLESNGKEFTIGIAVSKDIGGNIYGEIGLCYEISIELTRKKRIDFSTMIYSEIGVSLIDKGYLSIGVYKEIKNIYILSLIIIIIILLSYCFIDIPPFSYRSIIHFLSTSILFLFLYHMRLILFYDSLLE